jgi:glutamyl-tRNA synthetase
MPVGRYAPSPSGELHLGNLRTALLAWLWARRDASRFDLRFDDLDPATARTEHEAGQIRDLQSLGLDWDGPPVRQSERLEVYRRAVSRLVDAGLTYPCWCSRREIREAAAAPNGPLPPGAYPGTCRELSAAERRRRGEGGRRPAIRLRTPDHLVAFDDDLHGRCEGAVDDFVISRGDGVPAYNLAVVVDDAAQGIEVVVRGDDLLGSTPRQVVVAHLLEVEIPRYAHVPLVLGDDGSRLAKRDGAVSLADQAALGRSPADMLGLMAASLELAEPGEPVTAAALLDRFDPERLPRHPWQLDTGVLGPSPR